MIDYIASVFLIVGTYLVVKKKPVGWLIGCVGQVAWMLYGAFEVSSIPLILMEIVFTYLSLKGWHDWRAESRVVLLGGLQ